MVLICNNRGTDTNLVPVDDEDCSEQSMSNEVQSGAVVCATGVDEQDVSKHPRDIHTPTAELKQPRTIKSIMMALKEGKVRENHSPMRGSHTKAIAWLNPKNKMEPSDKVLKPSAIPIFRPNLETQTAMPTKTNSDTFKQVQGYNSLKYQVSRRKNVALIMISANQVAADILYMQYAVTCS